jgi:tetratricopeptide (TPR) repeat protein
MSRLAEEHHEAYERTGRLAELDLAIAGFTGVLDQARNVDIRSAAANGLGVALWSRYERFGDLSDLNRAIDLFREALAMYPDEQTPATPSFHANLAGVLRQRWRRTGSVTDLDESVVEIRAALAMTSPGDPRRSWRLNNLADGLFALSLRHDDSSALAEAVDLLRQAVECAGPGDDVAGMLANLAEALRLRYRSTGGRHRALLDEAVTRAREALAAAAPTHPLRPRFQSNLALILLDRYAVQRRPADLAEAAALARDAVDATPAGHPNRAERLLILSGIRRMELDRGVDPKRPRPTWRGRRAVRRMVKLAREAMAAIPEGHYLRADALLNEGSAQAFQAVSGDPAAFEAAIAAFRRVATDPVAPVRARVQAAWQWANTTLLHSAGRDLAAARGAFDLAVTLLPRVAPRHITHADRERQLAAFSGLARDAAAAALTAGDSEGALRLLEHGRGVLLRHALDARTEVTGLRERRPDLADRFEALRSTLDLPEGAGFTSGDAGAGLSGEDRHALAREWDRLLDEIRGLPGFAGFLRPPPVDDLLAATAEHGPIAVLNISGLRCDALLLAAGECRTMPLPVNLDDLAGRARRFRAAIAAAGHAGLPSRVREDARDTVAETLRWLWTAVTGPVLDALDLPAGARLWWVPTGPLTTLPLHAAGSPGSPSVLDRVTSSYAPTVRSLVAAWRTRGTGPDNEPAPLVVAMPTTPDLPDLPHVRTETAMLAGRFPGATVLRGEQAVRAAVLDALPRHAWVHFACHAVSAADAAADGHLVLHDHATAPLTVADIARLRLPEAQLAYLSACDTGVPEEDLGDEALHIAGACQMAGFRHVVGTLWAIRDATAPAVAADFYAALTTADAAAAALHHAVRALRDAHPDQPALWAPYIHVGP